MLMGRPWVSLVRVIRHLRPLNRVTHTTLALVLQLAQAWIIEDLALDTLR